MAYTAAEIKSAIDISRSDGFSDADIAIGLARKLPDAASVTAALAANPRPATTTPVVRRYEPDEIASAIAISREKGFSDADIATGLGRFLPNAAAVTTALADNPRPVATTTTTSTTGTGSTATTTGSTTQTLTPAIAKSLMYRSMTVGVPTAELDRYGGQAVVLAAAQAAGLQGNAPSIAAYETSMGLPPSAYTLRNATAAATTTTTGTGGTTTGTGGTATTVPKTAAEIASAIAISREKGFSDADIAIGLARFLPNAAAVTAALAANPRAATTTPVVRRYEPDEIASAIAISREKGFSDADIAIGLGRYLPNAAAVTAALAANPRAATTTPVARRYEPDEIASAINTSRQKGFSEADIAIGLGRFLPNAAAVTAALAANPRPATTATVVTAVAPQGLLATGAQGFNPNIAQPQRTYTSMTPASIGDTPITGTPYRNLYTPESVRQVYQSPQVMDAIRTSRAQGFNEADVRTGLLRYLSPQDADAAIAASLAPAPAAATGGLLSTATPAAAPNPYAAIRAATPAFAAPSSLNLGGTGGFDSSLYGQAQYKAPVAEVLGTALTGSGGAGGGDRADTNGNFGQDPSKVGVTDLSSYSDAAAAEAGLGEGFGGVGASPYAEGGSVRSLVSPNPPGPDDGYGSLQRGEYVIKKSAVDKYGEGLLGMINNGKISARKLKSLLE